MWVGLHIGGRGNLSVHCKIAKFISANYIFTSSRQRGTLRCVYYRSLSHYCTLYIHQLATKRHPTVCILSQPFSLLYIIYSLARDKEAPYGVYTIAAFLTIVHYIFTSSRQRGTLRCVHYRSLSHYCTLYIHQLATKRHPTVCTLSQPFSLLYIIYSLARDKEAPYGVYTIAAFLTIVHYIFTSSRQRGTLRCVHYRSLSHYCTLYIHQLATKRHPTVCTLSQPFSLLYIIYSLARDKEAPYGVYTIAAFLTIVHYIFTSSRQRGTLRCVYYRSLSHYCTLYIHQLTTKRHPTVCTLSQPFSLLYIIYSLACDKEAPYGVYTIAAFLTIVHYIFTSSRQRGTLRCVYYRSLSHYCTLYIHQLATKRHPTVCTLSQPFSLLYIIYSLAHDKEAPYGVYTIAAFLTIVHYIFTSSRQRGTLRCVHYRSLSHYCTLYIHQLATKRHPTVCTLSQPFSLLYIIYSLACDKEAPYGVYTIAAFLTIVHYIFTSSRQRGTLRCVYYRSLSHYCTLYIHQLATKRHPTVCILSQPFSLLYIIYSLARDKEAPYGVYTIAAFLTIVHYIFTSSRQRGTLRCVHYRSLSHYCTLYIHQLATKRHPTVCTLSQPFSLLYIIYSLARDKEAPYGVYTIAAFLTIVHYIFTSSRQRGTLRCVHYRSLSHYCTLYIHQLATKRHPTVCTLSQPFSLLYIIYSLARDKEAPYGVYTIAAFLTIIHYIFTSLRQRGTLRCVHYRSLSHYCTLYIHQLAKKRHPTVCILSQPFSLLYIIYSLARDKEAPYGVYTIAAFLTIVHYIFTSSRQRGTLRCVYYRSLSHYCTLYIHQLATKRHPTVCILSQPFSLLYIIYSLARDKEAPYGVYTIAAFLTIVHYIFTSSRQRGTLWCVHYRSLSHYCTLYIHQLATKRHPTVCTLSQPFSLLYIIYSLARDKEAPYGVYTIAAFLTIVHYIFTSSRQRGTLRCVHYRSLSHYCTLYIHQLATKRHPTVCTLSQPFSLLYIIYSLAHDKEAPYGMYTIAAFLTIVHYIFTSLRQRGTLRCVYYRSLSHYCTLYIHQLATKRHPTVCILSQPFSLLYIIYSLARDKEAPYGVYTIAAFLTIVHYIFTSSRQRGTLRCVHYRSLSHYCTLYIHQLATKRHPTVCTLSQPFSLLYIIYSLARDKEAPYGVYTIAAFLTIVHYIFTSSRQRGTLRCVYYRSLSHYCTLYIHQLATKRHPTVCILSQPFSLLYIIYSLARDKEAPYGVYTIAAFLTIVHYIFTSLRQRGTLRCVHYRSLSHYCTLYIHQLATKRHPTVCTLSQPFSLLYIIYSLACDKEAPYGVYTIAAFLTIVHYIFTSSRQRGTLRCVHYRSLSHYCTLYIHQLATKRHPTVCILSQPFSLLYIIYSLARDKEAPYGVYTIAAFLTIVHYIFTSLRQRGTLRCVHYRSLSHYCTLYIHQLATKRHPTVCTLSQPFSLLYIIYSLARDKEAPYGVYTIAAFLTIVHYIFTSSRQRGTLRCVHYRSLSHYCTLYIHQLATKRHPTVCTLSQPFSLLYIIYSLARDKEAPYGVYTIAAFLTIVHYIFTSSRQRGTLRCVHYRSLSHYCTLYIHQLATKRHPTVCILSQPFSLLYIIYSLARDKEAPYGVYTIAAFLTIVHYIFTSSRQRGTLRCVHYRSLSHYCTLYIHQLATKRHPTVCILSQLFSLLYIIYSLARDKEAPYGVYTIAAFLTIVHYIFTSSRQRGTLRCVHYRSLSHYCTLYIHQLATKRHPTVCTLSQPFSLLYIIYSLARDKEAPYSVYTIAAFLTIVHYIFTSS